MKEIWRGIVTEYGDYRELYEVSNFGRVRSLDRMCWNGNSWFLKKGRLLKLLKDSNGYFYVNLSKDGVNKHASVHRLVALAFIPNLNNLPQVNHKDENKENNRIDNLEWCTHEYNQNYGTKKERTSKKMKGAKRSEEAKVKYRETMKDRGHPMLGRTGKDNPTSKEVMQFSLEGELLQIWGSINEVERNTDFKCSNISISCRKKKPYRKHFWIYTSDYNKMTHEEFMEIINNYKKKFNKIN